MKKRTLSRSTACHVLLRIITADFDFPVSSVLSCCEVTSGAPDQQHGKTAPVTRVSFAPTGDPNCWRNDGPNALWCCRSNGIPVATFVIVLKFINYRSDNRNTANSSCQL